MPKRRIWTDSMDQIVRDRYSVQDPITLAKELGVTRASLRGRAFRLKAGPCHRDGHLKGPRKSVSSIGHTGSGYVRLTLHGGRQVLEHRYLMAQKLRRPLLRHEVVHHLNGVKTDNRLENLALLPSRSAHYQWHLDHPTVGEAHPSRYHRIVIEGQLFCSRCSLHKPTADFHKDSARRSGFSAYCRRCASAYSKARRQTTNRV